MSLRAYVNMRGLGCAEGTPCTCTIPLPLGENNIEYPIDQAAVITTVPIPLRQMTPALRAALTAGPNPTYAPKSVNVRLTPLPSIVNYSPNAVAASGAPSLGDVITGSQTVGSSSSDGTSSGSGTGNDFICSITDWITQNTWLALGIFGATIWFVKGHKK